MHLYDILGVRKGATAGELKRAYRAKAQRAHPDKGGSAHEFWRVNNAYQILRDATSRAHYDETGDEAPKSDEHAAMLQDMAQLILSIVENSPVPGQIDVFATAIWMLEKAQQTYAQQILMAERRMANLADALRRIHRKLVSRPEAAGGEDIFAEIFKAKMGMDKRQVEQIKTLVARNVRMLELLRQYEYRTDQSPVDMLYIQSMLGSAHGR